MPPPIVPQPGTVPIAQASSTATAVLSLRINAFMGCEVTFSYEQPGGTAPTRLNVMVPDRPLLLPLVKL
jgi:hypothetical protein